MSIETAGEKMIIVLKPYMVIYKSFRTCSVRSKNYKNKTEKKNKKSRTVIIISK